MRKSILGGLALAILPAVGAMWFEPERVAAGAQIAHEHPEFVFGGKQGGLFKLSDLAARRFLADLLSQRIPQRGASLLVRYPSAGKRKHAPKDSANQSAREEVRHPAARSPCQYACVPPARFGEHT